MICEIHIVSTSGCPITHEYIFAILDVCLCCSRLLDLRLKKLKVFFAKQILTEHSLCQCFDGCMPI